MAFEGLQDQLKEAGIRIKSQITESEIYNRLRESYYNQTPRSQSLIKWGALVVGVLVLINIPWGYINEANYNMSSYKERKDIIRGLRLAEKQQMSMSFNPYKYELSGLRSELEAKLLSVPMTKEQISITEGQPTKGLFPPKTDVRTFEISLNKMNVRQLANSLRIIENLNDSLVVTGITTDSDKDDGHYHNLRVFVTNFSLPDVAGTDSPPGQGRR